MAPFQVNFSSRSCRCNEGAKPREILPTLNTYVDGNKRTAWEAMKRFLKESGIHPKASPDEIVELMLRIEDKSLGVEQIAERLKGRSRKLKSRS